jgi:hypothetical protein
MNVVYLKIVLGESLTPSRGSVLPSADVVCVCTFFALQRLAKALMDTTVF